MLKKNFEKKIGEVLDIFELPHRRNFLYLEKNGILKFFEQLFRPELQWSMLTLTFFALTLALTNRVMPPTLGTLANFFIAFSSQKN